MTDRLGDVWTTRDRPVLIEVVRPFDEQEQPVSMAAVAEATGLELEDVGRDVGVEVLGAAITGRIPM